MARSFLTPIDLNGLELRNFRVQNLTGSNPTSAVGRLYFNATDNALRFYDNSEWKTIATGGSSITVGSTVITIGSTVTSLVGNATSNLTLGNGNHAFTIWDGATIAVNRGGTGTTTGSITGSTALTFTAGGSNQNINLRPTGTGSVNLNSTTGTDGFKITGLNDPTDLYDAANKKYVDGVAAGLNAHPAVNYATTGALGTTGNLLGGTITTTYDNGTNGVGATLTIATSSNWTNILIDGQNVVVGQRILIKNQGGTSSNLQNGIYVVTIVGTVGTSTSFVFTRADDSNTTPEVGPGDTTYVLAGSANGGNGFVQTATIVAIGTTPIAWSQSSGSSTTTAGLGLIPNGTNPNQIDVNPGTGLAIASDTIALANTAVTAGSYGSATGVGTFTVDAQGRLTAAANTAIGSLNVSVLTAGTLSVERGGTGAGTLTGIVKGNGTSAFTAATGTDVTTLIGTNAVTNATNATNATNTANTAITDDTTANATMYPTWVTTTTGNLPQKVTSSKLTFNPSTGTLSSTLFSGNAASLTNVPAANVTGTLTSTVLGNSALFVGTTSIALNRTTADQGLTGITSITGGTGTTDIAFNTAAVTGAASGAINLITGATTTSGTTGAVTLRSGNSAAVSGNVTVSTGTGTTTGGITIQPGTSTGAAGAVNITGGNTSSVTGGTVTIVGGAGTTTRGSVLIGTDTNNTGAITIGATTATTTNVSQTITIGSTSNIAAASAADTTIRGTNNTTNATTGNPKAGDLVIKGGDATTATVSATAAGGDVIINGGIGAVNGTQDNGRIFIGTTTARFITIGGTTATGAITLGQSTAAQTVNIATGINSAAAKTLNLGTGGTGSTTTVNINTSTGGSTIINGAVRIAGQTTNGLVAYTSTNGTLGLASAGTDYIAPYGSTTANQVLASPNGSAGTPTFRALVAADIPANLNQNTTGSAGSVTSSLVIKADSGTTEGTDLYTFNGSAAKTLNLVSGTGVTIAETSGTFTFNNSGVTSLNGSTGALGATANSNGSYTRYHRATCAAATTTAINHGLGQWVLVQVYKTSDGTIADVDVTNTSTSGGTTTVGFATAPGAGDYTIVIIG